MRWYRKAADQGDAIAQNSVGSLYQNGFGVTQSYEEAMRWYRMAADQGYAPAQINIGIQYQDGLASRKNTQRRCAGIAKPRIKVKQ